MIIQLSPCIPINTPKGPALAHFLIDYGMESDLYWVCFLDNSGECWTFSNKEIRAQKNITAGREFISPFYDPKEIIIKKCEHEWIEQEFRGELPSKWYCSKCGLEERRVDL